MNRLIIRLFVAAWLAFISTSMAQQTATPPDRRTQDDMGELLIQGLKDVDGCLAVKTCRWSDGKQSIVAWFENRAAAVSWYYSPTHQSMMGDKTDRALEKNEPMVHVEDTDRPIMVMATLTPADKPELRGIDIPISQISIELFAALPGGAQISGRVSPAGVQVPHMRDYSPSPAGASKGNGETGETN